MNDLTLLSYLKILAGKKPEKRLLGGEAGWLSAGRVLRTVENLGRNLLSLGLRPGDLAALRAERGVDTALLILGMRAAGVMAVLTGPRQEIDESLADCEADIHPRAKLERRADGSFSASVDGEEHLLALNDDAPDLPLPQTSPLDPGFVIFTSGSSFQLPYFP